ncbi:MAG TPA: hypothetical protein DDW52_27215 [Planctomycetaceae bacterium]|nr:hypothetical protein [Planctomycetaceae bacterium]
MLTEARTIQIISSLNNAAPEPARVRSACESVCERFGWALEPNVATNALAKPPVRWQRRKAILGVAATITGLAAGGIMLLSVQPTAVAFADVIAAVASTEALKCDIADGRNGSLTSQLTMSIKGSLRIDAPSGNQTVQNVDSDTAVILNSESKTFLRLRGIPNQPISPYLILASLHRMKLAEYRGQQELNGESTQVFEVAEYEIANRKSRIQIWVRKHSHLPIQISILDLASGKEQRLENIQFYAALPASTFSTEIPEGYQPIR